MAPFHACFKLEKVFKGKREKSVQREGRKNIYWGKVKKRVIFGLQEGEKQTKNWIEDIYHGKTVHQFIRLQTSIDVLFIVCLIMSYTNDFTTTKFLVVKFIFYIGVIAILSKDNIFYQNFFKFYFFW